MIVSKLIHIIRYLIRLTNAIIKSLKEYCKEYFSFSSEKTIQMPPCINVLNYKDDSAQNNLIQYNSFIKFLLNKQSNLFYCKKNYRPSILFILVVILEPITKMRIKNIDFLNVNWAYYGFKPIIFIKIKK